MTQLKVLESIFSVLRKFILLYQTAQTMRETLRKETEKTIFSLVFEKKTMDCHNTISCSVYLMDAAGVLKK